MNKVIQALKTQGVPEEKIQTAGFQINPEYSYNDKSPTLIGYRVTSTVRVTSGKPEAVGGLVDAAIIAGANQVLSVQFTVREAQKFQEEALAKAVANARQKADVTAGKLGSSISGLKRLQVVGQGEPVPFYPAESVKAAAYNAATPMVVQPGELDLKVSVSVEFNVK